MIPIGLAVLFVAIALGVGACLGVLVMAWLVAGSRQPPGPGGDRP